MLMKSFPQHLQPMGSALLESNNSYKNRLSVKKPNRTLKSQKRKQQFVHFRAVANTVPLSQAFVQGKAFLSFSPPLLSLPALSFMLFACHIPRCYKKGQTVGLTEVY